MAVAASTTLDVDPSSVAKVEYPYLKTTAGDINATLLSDISSGRLTIGGAVRTASYHEGGSKGGTSYRIVAAGTGTVDGGSYIDAGTVQLAASFAFGVPAAAFGVKADGLVGGDLAAINSAIAYSAANSATGISGLIQLPSGRINIGTGTIQVDGNMVLQGESMGATEIQFSGNAGVQVGAGGVTTLRSTVRDLTIDGQNTGNYGVVFGNATAPSPRTGAGVLKNVRVTGCLLAGGIPYLTAFLYLDNCDFHSNAGVGFLVDPNLPNSGQNTTIRAFGCRFQQNGLQGMKLLQGLAFSFIACSFEENQREGFLLELPVGPVFVNRAMWLTDCYWEDNLQDGAPGGQASWSSPGTGLIQQIILTRPFFSLSAPAADQWNMDIGSGIASVEYPHQLTGTSRVQDDSGVILHVKDYRDPFHGDWDWDSSTGQARINHEVWASDEWQRWTNSPAGAVVVDGYGINTSAPTVPVVTTSGATASRPTPAVGTSYFDTDLGYRIDGDGAQWVNSAGVAV